MANRSCTTCVYTYWDPGQWLASLSSGFPSRPICANHPDAPGLMKPVPFGDVCRNYRPKPPEPDKAAKRISLSDGLYAYVDAADYEWLSQWTWHLMNGYAGRLEKTTPILMHRQIMRPPKGKIVDHLNHSKLDNCRINLRVCTRQQNSRNRAKHSGVCSRFKGVQYSKQLHKWFARIYFEGKQIWLGCFDDEIEAARAYDRRAVELFGEYAWLNFPEEWPPERRQEVYANGQGTMKKEAKKVRRGEHKSATHRGKTKADKKKANPKRKPHLAQRKTNHR